MIEFTVSDVIPASPDEVYRAWLSSEGHSEMTGGAANASDEVGASFDAWDGYIEGKNVDLEPGRRIVQSWRWSECRRRASATPTCQFCEGADAECW